MVRRGQLHFGHFLVLDYNMVHGQGGVSDGGVTQRLQGGALALVALQAVEGVHALAAVGAAVGAVGTEVLGLEMPLAVRPVPQPLAAQAAGVVPRPHLAHQVGQRQFFNTSWNK